MHNATNTPIHPQMQQSLFSAPSPPHHQPTPTHPLNPDDPILLQEPTSDLPSPSSDNYTVSHLLFITCLFLFM